MFKTNSKSFGKRITLQKSNENTYNNVIQHIFQLHNKSITHLANYDIHKHNNPEAKLTIT